MSFTINSSSSLVPVCYIQHILSQLASPKHTSIILPMFFSISFPEYSSQLPSDGGTFYHPDTVDNAKPHYKKRWTPILHALAIWLHETGFSVGEMNKESDKNSTVPANAPANMKREEINSDRFYLILGIKLKIIHPYSC